MKKYLLMMLSFFLLFTFPQAIFGETTLISPKKVLLVYDSLRENTDAAKNVRSLERLFSSFRYEVTAKSMDQYKAKEMTKGYDAVVTMINWPEIDLENRTYYKDLSQYKGKTLHIGPKLTKEEKSNFPNHWEKTYQQEFQIMDSQKRYDEIIGYAQDLLLPVDISSKETIISYLNADRGKNKRETYPYGLLYQQHAYLPFYQRSGASLLSTSQLIAKWLNIKQSYDPYIAILGFSPLSNMTIARQFLGKIEQLENEIILSAASSSTNTDLNTFKVYLSLLKEFTLNKRSVIYLNTPALNNVGGDNNQLLNIMMQEVSNFVENGILPLGIAAPDYWNYDTFYQNSALNFARATLLYEFDKTPVYHTKTTTANAYPLMFYNINHQQLENINWHINGKYTEFTFPMPTTISYDFPESKKEMEKTMTSIVNDPFPPTDYYLYQFDSGISTQTQIIRGYHGMITLNGEPIVNIDFAKLNEQRQKSEKNKKIMEKQASTTVEKTAMNRLNDLLIVVIVATLIILFALLIVGRRYYLNMFVKKDKRGEKKK